MRELRSETQTARAVAVAMYADEPCRICGITLTLADVHDAVFAGYSKGSESRAAHLECWEHQIPQSEWAYPEGD